jgi:two-component system sensor histidine kinase UhpB
MLTWTPRSPDHQARATRAAGLLFLFAVCLFWPSPAGAGSEEALQDRGAGGVDRPGIGGRFLQHPFAVISIFIVVIGQGALIVLLIVQRTRRRTAEERDRLASTSGLIGVWDWNLETNEIYVDPQLKKLLGFEDHEIPNHLDHWGQRVHPDDREAVQLMVQMHLGGALPSFELEHRMLHKDGSIRWFLARGAAVCREGFKPVQMVGTDCDITERKASEEALKASQARAHELAGRLISAQETERTRIARELHDDASQRIAALSIGLGIIKRDVVKQRPDLGAELARLQDLIVALADQLRHFSHELHPAVLQRAGLIAALRDHCAEVAEQTDLRIDFQSEGVERVSGDAALCLYRVAQEALHNIGKHARATHVDVELKRSGSHLELTIADDGRGIDLGQTPHVNGLGLISLDERVRFLNGTLTVKSRHEGGTIVSARLPEQGERYATH